MSAMGRKQTKGRCREMRRKRSNRDERKRKRRSWTLIYPGQAIFCCGLLSSMGSPAREPRNRRR
jgi:hypothetical protein